MFVRKICAFNVDEIELKSSSLLSFAEGVYSFPHFVLSYGPTNGGSRSDFEGQPPLVHWVGLRFWKNLNWLFFGYGGLVLGSSQFSILTQCVQK